MSIVTIGIDVGKTWFHLVGLDSRGAIVAHQRFNRTQLLRYLGQLAPCLIGMEASCGGHRLARQLLAIGHDARLMSAEFVRPFVKGNRSDDLDAEAIAAEAIAEAVQRPTMRFIPVKMIEQLDPRAIHWMRSGLISRRTGVINQIRSFR
jgi:transposase